MLRTALESAESDVTAAVQTSEPAQQFSLNDAASFSNISPFYKLAGERPGNLAGEDDEDDRCSEDSNGVPRFRNCPRPEEFQEHPFVKGTEWWARYLRDYFDPICRQRPRTPSRKIVAEMKCAGTAGEILAVQACLPSLAEFVRHRALAEQKSSA